MLTNTATETALCTSGLLIQRNISDGIRVFCTTWWSAGTGIQTLVSVEGPRWAIEVSLQVRQQ